MQNSNLSASNRMVVDRQAANKIINLAGTEDIAQSRKKNLGKSATKSKKEKKSKLFEALLHTEAKMRQMESLNGLKFFAVNELKSLVDCQFIMLQAPTSIRGNFKVDALSSLAVIDQNAPQLVWLNDEVSKIASSILTGEKDAELRSNFAQFRLDIQKSPSRQFTFPYALTIILSSNKQKVHGAISFFSTKPFKPENISIARRLSTALSYSLGFWAPKRAVKSLIFSKWISLSMASLFFLAMFIPFPLTVLTSAEVVAKNPIIIAAPISGVIEKVYVKPNTIVKAGELLFDLNKVELQNSYNIAIQNASVAKARYQRANQDAFNSAVGRRELAIALAEYELAILEKSAATRRLEMSSIKATASGLLIYSDQQSWLGKPVVTGERIMTIADTNNVQLDMFLASEDSIILKENAKVRVFLDADPLNPKTLKLRSKSYEAELDDKEILAYKLTADFKKDEPTLRIGLRGTAQLYGEPVSLWFLLFRKPLAYLRQLFGV